MHEYSLVASLVDRVQREVDTRPGAKVRRLHVTIGELAGVEVELLRTAYNLFRERTVCEDAELAIATVAPLWRCLRCDRSIAMGEILRCSTCNRPAALVAGDDIILERIEMEVRDV